MSVLGFNSDTVSVDGSSAIAVCNTGDKIIYWGNLVLLSLSKHRDANRVLGIGDLYPLGVVLGPGIVGGSLLFTSLDEDAWEEAMQAWGLTGIFDQVSDIPPFDIFVSIPMEVQGYQSTESSKRSGYTGSTSLILERVRLLDESMVVGADKITLDQQYTFICSRASRLLSRRTSKVSTRDSDVTTIQSLGFNRVSRI